jgi:hypothetical protein
VYPLVAQLDKLSSTVRTFLVFVTKLLVAFVTVLHYFTLFSVFNKMTYFLRVLDRIIL